VRTDPLASVIVPRVPDRWLLVVFFIGAYAAGCTRERHATATPSAAPGLPVAPALSGTIDSSAHFWATIDDAAV